MTWGYPDYYMTSFPASPGGQGEESTQHYKDKVFYTPSSCCFLYNNIAAPQLFMVFVLSLIICMVYISKEEDANYRTRMESLSIVSNDIPRSFYKC